MGNNLSEKLTFRYKFPYKNITYIKVNFFFPEEECLDLVRYLLVTELGTLGNDTLFTNFVFRLHRPLILHSLRNFANANNVTPHLELQTLNTL